MVRIGFAVLDVLVVHRHLLVRAEEADNRRDDGLDPVEDEADHLVDCDLRGVLAEEGVRHVAGGAEAAVLEDDEGVSVRGEELDRLFKAHQEALAALERVLEQDVGVLHVLGLVVDVLEHDANHRDEGEDEGSEGHRAEVAPDDLPDLGEGDEVGLVVGVARVLHAGGVLVDEVVVDHAARDDCGDDGVVEEVGPQAAKGNVGGLVLEQVVRVDGDVDGRVRLGLQVLGPAEGRLVRRGRVGPQVADDEGADGHGDELRDVRGERDKHHRGRVLDDLCPLRDESGGALDLLGGHADEDEGEQQQHARHDRHPLVDLLHALVDRGHALVHGGLRHVGGVEAVLAHLVADVACALRDEVVDVGRGEATFVGEDCGGDGEGEEEEEDGEVDSDPGEEVEEDEYAKDDEQWRDEAPKGDGTLVVLEGFEHGVEL
mmetsp:Transcript_43552/g.145073  ORF Transcript_43552/g.145073 Transcript_43552/m.145073 type:complete len:430 (+) Transcript_43552:600-1889(+)